MKFLISILAIAVVASAQDTNTSSGSNGVKWTEIGKVADEIFALTKGTFHFIVEDARKAVPGVVPRIEAYLATRIPRTLAIFIRIKKEIRQRTLTRDKAMEYFTDFSNRLNQLRGEIRGMFADAKIPEIDAVNISKKVDENFQRIAKLGNSIDALF